MKYNFLNKVLRFYKIINFVSSSGFVFWTTDILGETFEKSLFVVQLVFSLQSNL